MLRNQSLRLRWQKCRLSVLIAIGCMLGGLLLVFLGPLPFIPLWRKDQQVWRSLWSDWKLVAEGARWPLLIYSAILYLRQPLIWLWTGLFAKLAGWFHNPTIARFGSAVLWPLTLDNILFHWILAWPLALLISHMLVPKRHTIIRAMQRVLTSQDQHLIFIQGKSKNTKHHSHRQSQSQRAKKATSSSKIASLPPAITAKPVVPSPTSLWGRTDWSQVPDNHPLKQEAMAAAQLLVQQPESEQNRQTEVQSILDNPPGPKIPDALTSTQASDEDDDWDFDKRVIKL